MAATAATLRVALAIRGPVSSRWEAAIRLVVVAIQGEG